MKGIWIRVFTRIPVLVLVLVLAFAGAGAVFAQEAAVEEEAPPAAAAQPTEALINAVALDLFPLFKGFIAGDSDTKTSFFAIAASFERIVAPHFTFGVELDLYPGSIYDIDYMYFGLSAVGRYYPLSESFDKFFMGAALGYNYLSIDGKTDAEHRGFTGWTIGLQAGYKLILTKNIYMEPSMKYVLARTSELSIITPVEWQGGLRIGYIF